MSFQREGITNVRAVVLPDGMAAGGQFSALSRTALVTWRSNREGMLHQVYVNGRLAGATVHPRQRQMAIQTLASFEAAVRVEVIAVHSAEAHVDFADQLDGSRIDSGRVKLTLLRSQNLPVDASVDVYFDNGTGEIDYEEPLSASPVPIWPCWQDKAGFGMASFGAGDFGLDSAASIGFGKGCFGLGEFGMDADVIEWFSPILPAGQYRFGVVVTDRRGNESTASETATVTIVPPARPAASLDIAAFDPSANCLTLSISDHA